MTREVGNDSFMLTPEIRLYYKYERSIENGLRYLDWDFDGAYAGKTPYTMAQLEAIVPDWVKRTDKHVGERH